MSFAIVNSILSQYKLKQVQALGKPGGRSSAFSADRLPVRV